jgi:hypothetical protein
MLINALVELASRLNNSSFIVASDNTNDLLLRDTSVMEMTVAKALATRLAPAPLREVHRVDSPSKKGSETQELNREQRAAEHCAVPHPCTSSRAGPASALTAVDKV